MAVDRADITKAHFFEQHTAVQKRLQGILKTAQHLLRGFTNQRKLVQQPGNISFQAVVERGDSSLIQIAGESSDARADAHLIVIQNDEQIFFQACRIVHSFEDDS